MTVCFGELDTSLEIIECKKIVQYYETHIFKAGHHLLLSRDNSSIESVKKLIKNKLIKLRPVHQCLGLKTKFFFFWKL